MHVKEIGFIVGRGREFFRFPSLAVGLLSAVLLLAACGEGEDTSEGTSAPTGAAGSPSPNLSGRIVGDGSSTVFPIAEAVAEEFGKAYRNVQVVVGISGTGGGFQKFCNGELDFSNASRQIRDSEKQACASKNVEYVELQVAFDGLSVLVHPSNNFVNCLTVAELKRIWEPNSTIRNWSEVRSGFPNQPLALYGPGTDSGTFDYFTEVIVGQARASRSDYTASEDDNVLVQGVSGDRNSLGYFGFAYYEENQNRLKLLGVDDGSGCVKPTREAILNNIYKPLSRPLFVYVKRDALQRAEVQEFFRFWMNNGAELAADVGYIESPDTVYRDGLAKLQ